MGLAISYPSRILSLTSLISFGIEYLYLLLFERLTLTTLEKSRVDEKF
jgi:hypothetical protein